MNRKKERKNYFMDEGAIVRKEEKERIERYLTQEELIRLIKEGPEEFILYVEFGEENK